MQPRMQTQCSCNHKHLYWPTITLKSRQTWKQNQTRHGVCCCFTWLWGEGQGWRGCDYLYNNKMLFGENSQFLSQYPGTIPWYSFGKRGSNLASWSTNYCGHMIHSHTVYNAWHLLLFLAYDVICLITLSSNSQVSFGCQLSLDLDVHNYIAYDTPLWSTHKKSEILLLW